jgi:hypothetical protein
MLVNSQNDQKAGRTGKLKRPESRNVGKPGRPESRNDRKSWNAEMIPVQVFGCTDAPCANRRSRRNNNLQIIFPGFFSCSVRPYYCKGWVWCTNSIGALARMFVAPCLLTQKSPNNWALLSGNEYTMLKRRQQNF